MDLIQLARGKKVTVHSAISATTTSEQQKSNGHNAIIIYFDITGSGTWTIKLQGRAVNGNYIDMYDVNGNLMGLSAVTVDKAQIFAGIPDDFKIVATEDVNGATCTVMYELLTV